jgi:hypothetical protein
MIPFTHSTDHAKAFEAYTHALSAALRVAKSRTADTGKYTYDYADLADVMSAVRHALSEKDAVLTQIPSGTEDGLTWSLTTMIVHTSGEWIAFAPYTRPQVKDEQGFGGALTYGRRYSLTSIFGIATLDDDAADVTEQQRNTQKYDGSRSPEELAIRTMMATFPPNKFFPEMFKNQFGRKLSDLPPNQHGMALVWVTQFFADPPVVDDSSPATVSPTPEAGGAEARGVATAPSAGTSES